jgi:hypothetical protein
MGRWSAISGLAKPRQIVDTTERVLRAPGDWKHGTWWAGRGGPEPQCPTPSGSSSSSSDNLRMRGQSTSPG